MPMSIYDVRFVRPEDVNAETDEVFGPNVSDAYAVFFDQRRKTIAAMQFRLDRECRTADRTVCIRRKIQ